jgi:mono/diheme cytochrome c family protein
MMTLQRAASSIPLLAIMLAPCALHADEAPQSVWQGVYTTEQADRGAKVAVQYCASCHGEALEGKPGARTLVGMGFMLAWEGKSVAELLTYVRTMMPPGQVGTLSDQDYVDVVVRILQANGVPARAEGELPAQPELSTAVVLSAVKPE